MHVSELVPTDFLRFVDSRSEEYGRRTPMKLEAKQEGQTERADRVAFDSSRSTH